MKGFGDTNLQPRTAAQNARYRREALGPYGNPGTPTGLMQGAKASDDEAVRARKMLADAGYGFDNTGVGEAE